MSHTQDLGVFDFHAVDAVLSLDLRTFESHMYIQHTCFERQVINIFCMSCAPDSFLDGTLIAL